MYFGLKLNKVTLILLPTNFGAAFAVNADKKAKEARKMSRSMVAARYLISAETYIKTCDHRVCAKTVM